MEKAHFPIKILCYVMKVSRQGYYKWHKGLPHSEKQHRLEQLKESIAKIWCGPILVDIINSKFSHIQKVH